MIDFIEYVVGELKHKRLGKENAVSLIQQFSTRMAKGIGELPLHPLVHHNTSDLSQQSYCSSFNGSEFFVDDHRVGEQRVLPGVAYLEMARAAIARALAQPDLPFDWQLQNVVWAQPFIVNGNATLHIALVAQPHEAHGAESNNDNGLAYIEFEIYSVVDEREVVHCQGAARYSAGDIPARFDMTQLKEQMTAGVLDGADIYQSYRQIGLNFGPGHQGVKHIFQGDGQVLAAMSVPERIVADRTSFLLHPSLMDGALQAAIGLVPGMTEQQSLPFALESLKVYRAFNGDDSNDATVYALLKYAQGGQANDKLIKLDIDLLDPQGNVCAQMQGFSTRIVTPSSDARSATGLLLAKPQWRTKASTTPAGNTQAASSFAQHWVLLCGFAEADCGALALALTDTSTSSQVSNLNSTVEQSASGYTDIALYLFEGVKRRLAYSAQHPNEQSLLQLVIQDSGLANVFVGLSGLLKTASLENPKLSTQLVLSDDVTGLGQQLGNERCGVIDAVVRYRSGIREVMAWQEMPAATVVSHTVFKEHGRTLITGGLGGLGVLFCRQILKQTQNAQVILTGRGALDEAKQALLAELNGEGERVSYQVLDIEDPKAVDALLKHANINGIIHSAGMLADSFIVNKSTEQFTAVLAPKVRATEVLDRASAALDLDFFVLFSSGASVLGNAGQGDYAVANGFMDSFSAHRNALVAQGLRKGQTLAFNWPLWQNGGMGIDATAEKTLFQATGMIAMQTDTGMQAFYKGFALGANQVLVGEGNLGKMRQLLGQAQGSTEKTPLAQKTVASPVGDPVVDVVDQAKPQSAVDGVSLKEQTGEYIAKQLASLLKMPAHKIDAQAPLENYGIDSILSMELTNELEKTFGSLSKTLFFEYQTLAALTEYFVAVHQDKLQQLFGSAEQTPTASVSDMSSTIVAPTPLNQEAVQSRHGRRLVGRGFTPPAPRNLKSGQTTVSKSPIAIVGLSGRYPASWDVAGFWHNLKQGHDCVEQVPASRWDWQDYYSEDRSLEGRHFSKWGGFIEGVDEFDPLFFNISPREAHLLDPQERLMLQHAWMAVEDAGLNRAALQMPSDKGLPGQVGVYVGVMYGEYQLLGAESSLRGKRTAFAANLAAVANRISYVLNLHGPSMTLDTMCSSSLTAIHIACQDLKLGNTDLAIAGGVNVSIHPNKYLMLSSGQFISSEGQCQSFGEGGDGYIPGEGVGAVVLQRLADATKQGSHIYGLITGSALSHGGKTNGPTVPNPQAQSSVIEQALKNANTDPRHVSYIEAHGTGTKLGDPIEISALTKVFHHNNQDNGYCLLGSAKSNIGHCESAAGIAGLTKILLQMKHKQVVPSLHSAKLNPHINFEATPFVVNQQLTDWQQPVIDGKTLPRIAGLSSFGAGGANAHLVIQEYEMPPPSTTSTEPAMVVLSARTEAQLQQKVSDLLGFIRAEQNVSLASLAYTLQVGREPLTHRLALLVSDISELEHKLAALVQQRRDVEDVFIGEVQKDDDGMVHLSQDDDMKAAIERWVARKKRAKLLDMWVKGLDLDWHKFYDDDKPLRISLPTYPFARDRYWADDTSAVSVSAYGAGQSSVLHPLLHHNTADLSRQSYRSTFSGDEFFLADHQVKASDGERLKILPGVAYLEMVRAAIEQALPGGFEHLQLTNTVWAQPIVVSEPTTVDLVLTAEDSHNIGYEIYTVTANETVLHCQGLALVGNPLGSVKLDLQQLSAQMQRGQLNRERFYQGYQQLGIYYGESLCGVDRIELGEHQLLAHIALPSAAGQERNDYVLHPSMLDSALQTCLGLVSDFSQLPDSPALPFALDTLNILGPLQREMLVWVRYAPGSSPSDSIIKLDIDLCDNEGNVCVQMQGFSSRVMAAGEQKRSNAVLVAQPVWRSAVKASDIHFEQHYILLCDLAHIDEKKLGSVALKAKHITSAAGASNLAQRYSDYARACFSTIKQIIHSKPSGKVYLQVVASDRVTIGLGALLKTASLENPKIHGQLLRVDETVTTEQLATKLTASDDVIVNNAQALHWQLAESLPTKPPVAFKEGGVYIITGGLGGLGRLFAHQIVAQTQQVTVILTGRGALTDDKQQVVDAIATYKGQVVYQPLDLDNVDALAQFIASLDKLNGILHSAGMTDDGLIINKSDEAFTKVLAPKVTGTENLHRAIGQHQLDFLVLFSSMASAVGNPGQADYACANGFMDGFAHYRNDLVAQGKCHGHTLSINWPLWAHGGMSIDADAQALITENTGMVALETANGMNAFYQSLAGGYAQTMVMQGDATRLSAFITPVVAEKSVPLSAATATEVKSPAPSISAIQGKTEDYLKEQLSQLLKMPSHEIKTNAALEDYGIDSVLVMSLTGQLEKTFGSLSKTLFFEYQTLGELTGYFVNHHSHTLAELFSASIGQMSKSSGQAKPEPVASTTTPALPLRQLTAKVQGALMPGHSVQKLQQVAIIGMSGRYPEADDLTQFWQNLASGKDSIGEVPADRWDVARYFNPARGQLGKSYSKWGGFINDVDKFDPLFFNISPKEAELIDPQERLFMQTVWHAIEDAGYAKNGFSHNRVGVYAGVMWGQYELYGVEAMLRGDSPIPTSSYASVANRISYFFNFTGPSMAVDTMCSSSLSAIHLAFEAIRRGDIDVAVAGGVNVTIHPLKYLSLSQGNFQASDGRCRSFGAGGDGYVSGEGVGALILKDLSQALNDGDHVYGVVKASVLNHGGKTNGYSVPNPTAQGTLILDAIKGANIDPTTIGYIETHGTGTSLGDPIEINGLNRAFAEFTDNKQFCPIGSVKSNIGHLESAAGVAAVTKVLLQLKHNQLVPSLHAEPLNPNIDFAQSPFYVQQQLVDWRRQGQMPRRVGVSSFGAGGSNAHLIIEEFIDQRLPPDSHSTDNLQAFVISARTLSQLKQYASAFVAFLPQSQLAPQSKPQLSLAALCYTTQVGRSAMNERLAIMVSSVEQLLEKLQLWLTQQKPNENAGIFQGNIKSGDAASLIDGAAGAAYLEVLMANAELSKMARLWSRGIDIDWQQLYRGQTIQRLSLPLYPFAKERCWIETATPVTAPVTTTPATTTQVATQPQQSKQMSYWVPQWQVQDITQGNAQLEGCVLLLGVEDKLQQAIAKQYPSLQLQSTLTEPLTEQLPQFVLHQFDGDDIDGALQSGLYTLFALCQNLLKAKPAQRIKILSVCNGYRHDLHAALGGFFKTLALENPMFKGVVVSTDSVLKPQALAALAVNEWANHSPEVDVNYVGGTRQVSRFVQVQMGHTVKPLFKQGGVYLITGGLGGLGYLFAEHLATTYDAKLVLLGRSALKAAQQQKIDQLAVPVLYLSADVAQLADMQQVVAQAKQRFGQLNGVIHSAGVNRDDFILNKTIEQIAAVLQPKVYGTVNLDMATQDEKLDCFILFSSVSGALGNLGQCDYAYANHFLDAFAHSRQIKVAKAKRCGQSLSVNWPFWARGGMTLDAQTQLHTEQTTGLSALPKEIGIVALETLLAQGVCQAATLYGDVARINAYINKIGPVTSAQPQPRATPLDLEMLNERTAEYLKGLVSQQTKLAIERVYSDERFESFGFDSVMIGQFNAMLERDLGALPKTLLYEYDTIDDLAAYLVTVASGPLNQLFDIRPTAVVAATTGAIAPLTVAAALTEPYNVASSQGVANSTDVENEGIAIIGLHGQYPQSADLEAFWQHLCNGDNLVQTVPSERWDKDAFYHPDPAKAAQGKIYCQWGSFLDGFDQFDAPFFNINKTEADNMDPQERLFLQSVWAAIEDAGYTPQALKQKHPIDKSANVGVYVGVTTNTYQLLAADQWRQGNVVSPGNLPWSIANRVSYFFDFKGPSLPVDTACSSSLVAIEMACEGLQKGACQLAIAGGVNLYLHPTKYHALCQKGMVAQGDKCYSYGAGDDGFVPGEGVGSLVLKPLARAIDDQDQLYGVIRAANSAHSGRGNGYSAPNPNAQTALIVDTLNKAQVSADSINYVEGHGTGTQLGDNLEITALTNAFSLSAKQVCPLGSVKGNLGHSESAAGITGLTKILLQLKHQQLLPSIHSSEVNPNIDFTQTPFYLQHQLSPWTVADGQVRRAMINSFGAGGVNASIIVEQANRAATLIQHQGPWVCVLSAKSNDRLKAIAVRLMAHLARNTDILIADLAYTLQVGREAMDQRLALVVDGIDSLKRNLGTWIDGESVEGVYQAKAKRSRGKGPDAAVYQDLAALAQYWTEGEPIDWHQCYPQGLPLRISLPTYPFAAERHWVSDSQLPCKTLQRDTGQSQRLHPLVSNNYSTLKAVAFNSDLSDSAYYAEDHQVKHHKILPGAAFLEIAAICGSIAGEQRVAKICDIVWIKPLSLAEGPQSVRTCLKTIGEATEVEINSLDDDMEVSVHCEGRIYFGQTPLSVADTVSLDTLKALCGEAKSGAQYYRQFDQAGLNYGITFQSIKQMFVSDHFVLSRLSLAQSLKADFDQYMLHPALIDAALQSTVGLSGADSTEEAVPHLPFALDEVEILRPLSPHCYALVELSSDSNRAAKMKKFNIQLLSDDGEVLVRLKGLYVRALTADNSATKSTGISQ